MANDKRWWLPALDTAAYLAYPWHRTGGKLIAERCQGGIVPVGTLPVQARVRRVRY